MIICIRLLSYSSTILFVWLIDWLFVCLIDCLFGLLLSFAISCILHAVCLVGLIQQITQVCPENCEKDKGSASINMLFEFKKKCSDMDCLNSKTHVRRTKDQHITINSMPNGFQVPRSSRSLRLSSGIENMSGWVPLKIETMKNLWTGHQTQTRQKDATWGWVKTLAPCREPQVIAGIYGCSSH